MLHIVRILRILHTFQKKKKKIVSDLWISSIVPFFLSKFWRRW